MKNIFLALSLFTAQLNVTAAQEIHVAEADTHANCLTRCFQRLGIRHTPSARIEKGHKLVAARLTAEQLTQILNDYEAITEVELTRSPSTTRELEGVIDAFERLKRYEVSTRLLYGILPGRGFGGAREQGFSGSSSPQIEIPMSGNKKED